MEALNSKYLFDASSLIYALKLKCINILYNNYTQQLAVYEVLNALRREVHLVNNLTHREALQLVDIFKKILEYMKVLSIKSVEADVLSTALKLGVTVYDASYIVLAQKNNLTLVTEDKRLRSKSIKLINTVNLEELVRD